MPTILDTLQIATCAVSYGKESSFAGVLADVSIKVTPMALGVPQLRLVWAATGDIFSSFYDTTAGASGAPGIIVLPQTGQDGFRHGSSTFKDWYYLAQVTAKLADGQTQVRTYRFQIAAGQTTLDLDTLDEDGVVTALPAIAPILPVTSVAGLTGEVTLEQLQDAGVGGLDAAAVDAKIATQASADAAAYVTFDGTSLRQNGQVVPISGSASGLALDTDGVPYYSASGTTAIALDADGVPYLAA